MVAFASEAQSLFLFTHGQVELSVRYEMGNGSSIGR
jgi:hypothetical protein